MASMDSRAIEGEFDRFRSLGLEDLRREWLKVLRGLIATAMPAGLIGYDPTLGIRNPKLRATGGFKTWSEEEIAQFEAIHPIVSHARLAFGLSLYTGQRRGDVIRMGRQHVRAGFLQVRQEKTSAVLEIPLHPALQEILAAHPAEHLTFLTTRAGEPFTAAGFTGWFRDRCREAGLPLGLSAHGLRKATCRRLAEAGCSANQIAAISGHATLREVERYTKAASQKRMAAAAMEVISGTNTGKPIGKVSKARANSLKINDLVMRLATPAGFEPATCRLEGGCSIQLSYGVVRALRSSSESIMALLLKASLKSFPLVTLSGKPG